MSESKQNTDTAQKAALEALEQACAYYTPAPFDAKTDPQPPEYYEYLAAA